MKALSVAIFIFMYSTASGQHIVLRDSAVQQKPMQKFVLLPVDMKKASTIPQNYHTSCFGFFCRQELKMQRANIPVTFRLGSMDYVNKLEGKTP